MKNNHNLGGFTLIELLVVVLIIGILSAIALPQYQKAVLKSRTAQAVTNLKTLDQAQRVFYMENGFFSGDASALGVSFLNITCNDTYAPIVYCNAGVLAPNNTVTSFEWQANNSTGQTRYVCFARTTNTNANAICQQYQSQWGGTSVADNGNGYTYYYGGWTPPN